MKKLVLACCILVGLTVSVWAQQPTQAPAAGQPIAGQPVAGQPTNTYVTETPILQNSTQQPSPSDVPSVIQLAPMQDSVMEAPNGALGMSNQAVSPVPAGTMAASADCGCHGGSNYGSGYGSCDCCYGSRRGFVFRRFFGRRR